VHCNCSDLNGLLSCQESSYRTPLLHGEPLSPAVCPSLCSLPSLLLLKILKVWRHTIFSHLFLFVTSSHLPFFSLSSSSTSSPSSSLSTLTRCHDQTPQRLLRSLPPLVHPSSPHRLHDSWQEPSTHIHASGKVPRPPRL
jgi:hypothetical protein